MNEPAPIGHNSAETPEEFVARRDQEINVWLNYKSAFVAAQERERNARADVASTLFPTPKKGTQAYQLNGGYAVKLVQGYTYTLGDKDKVDESGQKITIRKQIEEVEKIAHAFGPLHASIWNRLVVWEPKISGSEYEKLDPEDAACLDIRNLVDEILTIKPNSPQLKFEEPKAK